MAETEIKSINRRPLCDQTARDAAKSCVKTVNGVTPDENGNVVISNVDNALFLTEGERQVIVTSNNLFSKADVETGGYYVYTNGSWAERSDICSTGYIPCKAGDVFYSVQTLANDSLCHYGGNVTCYDENYDFIVGVNVAVQSEHTEAPIVIPNNENIRYFRISLQASIYTNPYAFFRINKDEIKPYDEYCVEIRDDSSGYYAEHPVFAPNITTIEDDIAAIKSGNVMYFEHQYNNEVTIQHKRSKVYGTTYWMFIINDKKFDGSTIKPRIVGTDASNPLGGSGVTNVSSFAVKDNYLHVVNGGIFCTQNYANGKVNEADGITIIDGNILRSTGVEQFAVEQYVLGIDANGHFKTYRNETAENILADGCIHAVTAFVPLVENGEAVNNSVLSVCPHYNVKHPRQVIGRLKDGKYFTFACDGRTDGEAGMTLAEVIDTITADLPVEFAFNLDGGGSTQSVVGKKLVNRILDNRAIPNVIVFA